MTRALAFGLTLLTFVLVALLAAPTAGAEYCVTAENVPPPTDHRVCVPV